MICKKCKQKFRYIDIPIDERIYKAFYSIVFCPACGVLLRPTRMHTVTITIAMLSIFLPVIYFTLLYFSDYKMASNIPFAFLALGVILFFLSFRFVKTEIVTGYIQSDSDQIVPAKTSEDR